MSRHTKASILWIILLRSRTFALGDMEVLAAFSTMHTDLCAKQGLITHAEVPALLLQEKNPPKSHQKADTTTTDPPPTKRVRDNKNNWHPLLKSKLEGPLATAGFPTFTAIMKYCDGAVPSSAVPRDGKVCSPNIFFGEVSAWFKMYKIA